MLLCLAASLLEPNIWFGGSTNQFCKFLYKANVPNIVVDVAHVPVVPRMVFDTDRPDVLPQMPADVYSVSSKYNLRLLKGRVFPPPLLNISTAEERYAWSSISEAQLGAGKSRKVFGPFNNFFTVGELLDFGKSGLRPPNPIFEKLVFYVQSGNMVPAQGEEVVAEMIEHDIVTKDGKRELQPRVAALRAKILKTMDEYLSWGSKGYESLKRLDLEVLRSLDLSIWRTLLSTKAKSTMVPLEGRAEAGVYEKLFRRMLKDDPEFFNQSAMKDFFGDGRTKRFDLWIGNDFSVSHGFIAEVDGESSYVMF